MPYGYSVVLVLYVEKTFLSLLNCFGALVKTLPGNVSVHLYLFIVSPTMVFLCIRDGKYVPSVPSLPSVHRSAPVADVGN